VVPLEPINPEKNMSSNSNASGRLFWGNALIALGTLLLLDQLDILDFGQVVSDYWPLILVIIGLKVILFPSEARQKTSTVEPILDAVPNNITGPEFPIDYLTESRFIGDMSMRIVSEDFRGGAASTFIGDLKLDLTGIRIRHGDRALTISGFIGDAFLRMPKDLAYSIHANAAIGDFKIFGRKNGGFGLNKIYKSADYDEAPARLNLRISFFIGDVTVV